MNLIEDLTARGLIEHHSADLTKIFSERRTLYIGTDPTADSLHVGHLVWLLLLKRLGDAGHSLIVLVGGGTGMIGDPRESGERSLLDEATLRHNTNALKRQIQSVLGRLRFRMVDNADWLRKVKLVDFLRDTGKYFTVNELIKRDLIKRRLDTPNESISYTEFTYALLQGYDFRELNRKYNCTLQLGGSDQWTNILSGVDLIRKKDSREVFAVSFPLVTDATGKKFGKSEGNAVWLDPQKTTPFDFYQYWLTQDDRNVGQYLKIFTFLPLVEIDAIMELHTRNPERRVAQKKLAEEVTRLVHGDAETQKAVAKSEVVFGGTRDINELKQHVQTHSVRIGEDLKIVDYLVTVGLVTSKSEARRLMEGGGVTVNGEKVTDTATTTASYGPGDYEIKRGTKSSVLSIEK